MKADDLGKELLAAYLQRERQPEMGAAHRYAQDVFRAVAAASTEWLRGQAYTLGQRDHDVELAVPAAALEAYATRRVEAERARLVAEARREARATLEAAAAKLLEAAK